MLMSNILRRVGTETLHDIGSMQNRFNDDAPAANRPDDQILDRYFICALAPVSTVEMRDGATRVLNID